MTYDELKPFCGNRFKEPWILDGWMYATDGFLCVRVPTTAPNTEEQGAGDAAPGLFAAKAHCTEPWAPPAEATMWEIDCPDCEGTGKARCDVCDGTGECACPCCDEEHTCGACGGEGHEDGICGTCEGSRTAMAESAAPAQIGRWSILRHAACLMARLPNVRYQPTADGKMIRFTFDGGEGVVMALREPTPATA